MLKLNPSKMDVMLVGSTSVLGNGCAPRLVGVALTNPLFTVLGVLLDLGLLLDVQIAAVARAA